MPTGLHIRLIHFRRFLDDINQMVFRFLLVAFARKMDYTVLYSRTTMARHLIDVMLLQRFSGECLLGAPFETCMRIYMVWREKESSVVYKQ